MKRFAIFGAKVVAAQVTTNFLAGAAAYPLLTKEFYVGANPVFATFLRAEAGPDCSDTSSIGSSQPRSCGASLSRRALSALRLLEGMAVRQALPLYR
jgi:hypothetical protein